MGGWTKGEGVPVRFIWFAHIFLLEMLVHLIYYSSMTDEDVLLALIGDIEKQPVEPAQRPGALKMLTMNGVTMAERAWAAHANMTQAALRKRLERGMTLAEAIERPMRAAPEDGDPVWMILKAEKAKPCTDCKTCYHPDAMEFDHVRGEKKSDISKIRGRRALLDELAKCELVCANCHRIRTAGRRRR
jgi:hypothetical protein